MNKLYFKYGVMGSSKTAQALMTKFNYEEKGSKVWLIKPATDVRDGLQLLRSRIGLEANAFVVPPEMDLKEMFSVLQMDGAVYDVIIADEAQFFTEKQIWQLREIVSEYNIPVMCFGLRTDFRCRLFPGSKALFQVADDILDVTGDEEIMGKKTGSDESSQKATYPSLYGLDESRKRLTLLTDQAKEALAKYYDNAEFFVKVADELETRCK